MPENEDLKRKVFMQMEQYADDSTVLCSSTSCIVPSKFTDQLKRRNQCIVAHPVSNMDKECGILLYKLLVIKEHDCFTLCLFCYFFDYSVTHRTIAL